MPGATPVGRARIPPVPPVPPAPPAPPAFSRAWWQTFRTDAVRLFHAYANWLVSITWKRFFLLSLLLLILAAAVARNLELRHRRAGREREERRRQHDPPLRFHFVAFLPALDKAPSCLFCWGCVSQPLRLFLL